MSHLDETIKIYQDCRDRAPGNCDQCPLRESKLTLPGFAVFPTPICTILQIIDNRETVGDKRGLRE